VLPTFLLELRITVMAMVYEKYGDFLAAEHLAGQLADLEIMSEDDYLTDHYEWRIRNRLINEFKIPPSGLKKFEEFKKKEWELRKKLKVTEIIPVTRVDLFSFLDWSLCQQVSAEKLAVILAWYETDRYDLLDNIPAQEWKTFEDNLKSYKKQSIRRARKKRNTLKIEYITVAVESAV